MQYYLRRESLYVNRTAFRADYHRTDFRADYNRVAFEVIIYQIFGPIKIIILTSAGDHNHNNLSGARRADFGQVLVIYWSLLQYK